MTCHDLSLIKMMLPQLCQASHCWFLKTRQFFRRGNYLISVTAPLSLCLERISANIYFCKKQAHQEFPTCCSFSAKASHHCLLKDDSSFCAFSNSLYPLFLPGLALSTCYSVAPSFFLCSVAVNSFLLKYIQSSWTQCHSL